MTHIESNGSKWMGEEPDSIEELLQVLATNALDPTFEDFGDFAERLDVPETWRDPDEAAKHPGEWRFFGNFFELSHVFQIDTNEAETIKKLQDAIAANKQTEGYKKARENWTPCEHCGGLTTCKCDEGKKAQRASVGANI